MSSSVARPRMLPNSSTTMARPVRGERNWGRRCRGRLVLLCGADAIEKNPDHVLDVNEAEDVVERAFVDWNPRALRGGEHAHRIFERRVGRKRMNVGPRHHDFAD